MATTQSPRHRSRRTKTMINTLEASVISEVMKARKPRVRNLAVSRRKARMLRKGANTVKIGRSVRVW